MAQSVCPNAPDGRHDWRKIGACFHTSPAARSGSDYGCYEGSTCGRVGHSRPRSFACGMPKRKPDSWEAILTQEAKACPIYERLQAQARLVPQ
jgi:hypothetical protein